MWGWIQLIFSRYPRTTQRSLAVATFFAEQRSRAYDAPAPSGWSAKAAE